MDSSFYEVHDTETLWGILLCAGMLTAEEVSADGMCTFMISDYNVESNRESGLGRSDIILRAKTEEKPNIIMEFKYTKDENKELRELAQEGLEQIRQKDYAAGLRGEVVCIGLGHRGKEAELEWTIRESGMSYKNCWL